MEHFCCMEVEAISLGKGVEQGPVRCWEFGSLQAWQTNPVCSLSLHPYSFQFELHLRSLTAREGQGKMYKMNISTTTSLTHVFWYLSWQRVMLCRSCQALSRIETVLLHLFRDKTSSTPTIRSGSPVCPQSLVIKIALPDTFLFFNRFHVKRLCNMIWFMVVWSALSDFGAICRMSTEGAFRVVSICHRNHLRLWSFHLRNVISSRRATRSQNCLQTAVLLHLAVMASMKWPEVQRAVLFCCSRCYVSLWA